MERWSILLAQMKAKGSGLNGLLPKSFYFRSLKIRHEGPKALPHSIARPFGLEPLDPELAADGLRAEGQLGPEILHPDSVGTQRP